MMPVVLAGGTGLVGQAIARRLEQPAFDPVWLLVRRDMPRPRPHHRIRVVNFNRLDDDGGDIDLTGGAALCALGTTLRKAGSEAAFQAVDRDRVMQIARWAHGRGAVHFLFVSSLGANPDSRNFYLRTKGETEKALGGLGFERLTILRPSLLLGPRREFRFGERLGMIAGRLLTPVLSGPLLKYRPVPADRVAAVMVNEARRREGLPVDVWESDRISRFPPDSAR